jgi:pimeloyl-ACP methyl ester carboxylesterase
MAAMPVLATTARSQVELARQSASRSVELAQRSYRRHVQGQHEVSMLSGKLEVDGHLMRYGISSNDVGGDQLWAINIHGFFCGGSMYFRESEQLAEAFGWRVVNPSLPGFGGSEPLAWKEISMPSMARRIEALMDHLGVGRAILLGHSMGGGVAVEFAAQQPERVLGIVYRDGVATPSWHQRHGVVPLAFSSIAPDVGPVADLALSVVFDIPDLLIGRMLSTVRSLIPDIRRNFKTMARTAPVASMLMEVDLSEEVAKLGHAGIPILAEWGCFDRISNAATANEFSEIAEVPIQWIPGGHSWMLARPSGQTDVLRFLPVGRTFLEAVEERAGEIGQPRLRAVR